MISSFVSAASWRPHHVLCVVPRCHRRSKSTGTHSRHASLFGVHRSRRVARRCNPTHACCCGMVPRLIGTGLAGSIGHGAGPFPFQWWRLADTFSIILLSTRLFFLGGGYLFINITTWCVTRAHPLRILTNIASWIHNRDFTKKKIEKNWIFFILFLIVKLMWNHLRTCVLLCAVVCCCMLLCAVVCCCVLLCAVVCCCVLLYAVVCCCVLLCAVVSCCVLLYAVLTSG